MFKNKFNCSVKANITQIYSFILTQIYERVILLIRTQYSTCIKLGCVQILSYKIKMYISK